jgi:hypothetical protein
MLKDRIAAARDFILRHARLIDRYRFAYHFEGGSAESVTGALLAYRNSDGGFGNALEPDKRDPHSQPVDLQTALEILDEVDRFDLRIAQRACDWLNSISTREGGVPFALPTVKDFPHAPWWSVDAKESRASLNPTAAILGLLLKHGVKHSWIDAGSGFCWQAIETTETVEFHDLMPMIRFLENTPDQPRAKRELARIARRVQTPGTVETDPAATGYLHKPLDWAPNPQSFCAQLFDDELIALHLATLAERQRSDGGWPISWLPVSPAVEIEWRGVVTLSALRTLRAYGWDG